MLKSVKLLAEIVKIGVEAYDTLSTNIREARGSASKTQIAELKTLILDLAQKLEERGIE